MREPTHITIGSKNSCLYNAVALSTSFVVVKMDPDRYHNEGANHAWGNSNVSYFPPPPPPVEIPQPTVHVEIPYFPPPPPPVETPQPTVHVEIPQPTTKVKAPIFHPTTQVNAGLFHVPTSFKPAPVGSKIKILINELVHLDNFVCYNTLCLMNVLDQSLYGIANAGDDTEIRVTFRNGMDPSFKKVFLDMTQKGKKIYKSYPLFPDEP